MISQTVEFQATLSYGQKWSCSTLDQTRVWVRGSAFWNDRLFAGEELAVLLRQLLVGTEPHDLKQLLRELNGHYAFVIETEQRLIAAVDRIRSIPLFYGKYHDHLLVSDDAYWIQQKVIKEQRDKQAEIEFLLTGYVTGSDTLYAPVKQLQAGQSLVVVKSTQGLDVALEQYYEFLHEGFYDQSEQDLLLRLDEVLLQVFERLVCWADGRMLVVPLSGGYDSRLILVMLKRLQYQNVLAFTFGRPGNRESVISETIAKSLGIQWEFVTYDNASWRKWFQTEERKAYYRMADGLSSIPLTTNWPAVWTLKQEKRISEDSAFLPGHTGDFISGGHIPGQLLECETNVESCLVDAILKQHYSLWRWNEPALESMLRERVRARLSRRSILDATDAVDMFEEWEWAERQSKFIVNSVRVYEFWGYRWSLPLWDAEFMTFWSKVPLELRVRQRLYKRYVNDLTETVLGFVPPYARQKITRMKNLVRKSAFVGNTLKKGFTLLKRSTGSLAYYKHPLALYGVMSPQLFVKLYTGRENFHSFSAADKLGYISFKSSEIDDSLFSVLRTPQREMYFRE